MKVVSLIGALLLSGMLGCSQANPRVATTLNRNAALEGNLPLNPLQGRVITSWINKSESTMSTLYGNDVAVDYARTNSKQDYPGGSVISLVTWNQQEDDRWFGAKIPDTVKSVEYVFVKTDQEQKPSYTYQKYEGRPLRAVMNQAGAIPGDRALYLLSQRAAVMP